jgi:ATP-dependent helicase/nuclease subunit A
MTTRKDIEWTDQQARAIAARGANVLVTASAGTGKTAVLSGRCVDLVSDAAACPDVRNMLVLTFTEAAAEEMRSRIAQRLREAFRQRRETRLGRQLILLQGADISTIHAFCRRLISEHFHELALDPAFRVIDADEAMLLKSETLADTIGWAWQQPNLGQGLEALLRRRDLRENEGFLTGLLHLNDFLDGIVSREAWYARAGALADATDPLTGELGQAQRGLIEKRLDAILARWHAARDIYNEGVPDGKWSAKLEEQLIEPVAACLERLRGGDWDGCAEMIRTFEPKTPSLRGCAGTLGDVIKDLRDTGLKSVKGLRDLAVVNPQYLDVVGRSTSLQTKVLVELLKRLGRSYTQKKRMLNGLDFADLEHNALRLLAASEPRDGTVAPSETARALRRWYQFIFVDEYQDINPVQQAILDALSSGDNVFVVGDVKQSIYGWRGAAPTIFLEHLAAAAAESNGASAGLRLDLNYNFRSATGILDFVNAVFGRIMTEPVAHLDYDETAQLRPAPGKAPKERASRPAAPLVEFHVLDEKAESQSANRDDNGGAENGDNLDSVSARQRQAMLIAQRIRELVGAADGRPAAQIQDRHTDAWRDVEYRDIVVLMRSLAKKANDYVEVFRLLGVPVNCAATAGYFEATEISDVLCLLKVLDNPQRDIELAAVLRSPFFAFSDTDLTRLRVHAHDHAGEVDFHAGAMCYRDAGTDSDLKARVWRAFDQLDDWRGHARRGHLAELLWRIYRETNYIAFVSALPNGQARKANLLKLHDRAVQFEGFASSAGIASLTRFVAFIEKLQEAGQDWAPAQPGSAADNAVRILSVHKSKGLEFPVVFLAELETQFNLRDVQADLVVDAEDTLGLQVIDPSSNTKHRSLAHQLIGEKKRVANLAEEMRILYVATTRARDRLILTASQKRTDCGQLLARGLLVSGRTVPDWLVGACKNSLEWVLYGLADQRVLHEAFDTGLSEKARDDALFEFSLHGVEELRALSQRLLALRAGKARSVAVRAKTAGAAGGKALLSELKKRLGWQYPFAAATQTAAKNSVTVLTHQSDEFARLDYSRALERRPTALGVSEADVSEPRGRVLGTATHLVLAGLDLAGPVTAESVEATKERLVAEGVIVQAVAGQIDAGAVTAFFETDLGSLVLDKKNKVWQEWPFTFARAAADDRVVVQGIIDMLVRTPDGLVVIDFKTDRVGDAEFDRRVEAYRGQLSLYAEAAAEILNEKVNWRWLYFLTPRQAVEV